MTRIATIARDFTDSPNMSESDAAILAAIADELKAMGTEIVTLDNEEIQFGNIDAVCHMSRNSKVLEMLARAEEHGIRTFNRSSAVKQCSRETFTSILHSNGIPQAKFHTIYNLEQLNGLNYPAWIKKAEGWSCHKDDVCYAANAKEATDVVLSMKERGICNIIHAEHIKGDIIKFYGVGNEYFRYCYPDQGKSKFGLEKMNGEPHHYPFDTAKMEETARNAAKAVGLEIYGGDCIVTAEGDIYIIDLNDFPSFSAIRKEAAKEIAIYIKRNIEEETMI